MIWDQLLSSWAWCLTAGTHNHTKPNEFAYYGGPYPRYLSKMVNSVVGWQLLLTPCLLSTWFGDWLASQSPNPSWQHRVSLKHLQNTVILCHFVSLVCMLCHMGGWGMVCRHLAIITHNLINSDKHMVLFKILVLGLLDWQVLRSLILQTKIYVMGVATYWVVSVNLLFCWKNCHSKAWKVWTTKLPN